MCPKHISYFPEVHHPLLNLFILEDLNIIMKKFPFLYYYFQYYEVLHSRYCDSQNFIIKKFIYL
jgi:hypothetical protein